MNGEATQEAPDGRPPVVAPSAPEAPKQARVRPPASPEEVERKSTRDRMRRKLRKLQEAKSEEELFEKIDALRGAPNGSTKREGPRPEDRAPDATIKEPADGEGWKDPKALLEARNALAPMCAGLFLMVPERHRPVIQTLTVKGADGKEKEVTIDPAEQLAGGLSPLAVKWSAGAVATPEGMALAALLTVGAPILFSVVSEWMNRPPEPTAQA